jgi:hypothetical protein
MALGHQNRSCDEVSACNTGVRDRAGMSPFSRNAPAYTLVDVCLPIGEETMLSRGGYQLCEKRSRPMHRGNTTGPAEGMRSTQITLGG